jgi:hypothetical protein
MISPAGVHCVWLRHDLETIKKRLKALEAKSLQEGLVLTEAQSRHSRKPKRTKRRTGNLTVNALGTVLPRTPFMWDAKACGTNLPADFHRYVQEGGILPSFTIARIR